MESNCSPTRKNILTSANVWTIILLAFQAVGPTVDEVIVNGKFTLRDGWKIAQVVAIAVAGAIARYQVGDLYTPRGLPGVDPPSRRMQEPHYYLPEGTHRR